MLHIEAFHGLIKISTIRPVACMNTILKTCRCELIEHKTSLHAVSMLYHLRTWTSMDACSLNWDESKVVLLSSLLVPTQHICSAAPAYGRCSHKKHK